MHDVLWLDATAQADLIRRGELSPAELLTAVMERIGAVNPLVDAVIRYRFDEARAEVAPAGPFRGVPMVLKDLGCTVAGEVTAFGLEALREHRWTVTSYLAERWRAAGFVVVGRTNTPELATTVTTERPGFPATRNPWDRSRSAGGSSGGTAAAVASGMVAVGHATDGGGSIRIPASACGVVGLKPTRGRVSQGPEVAESWAGATTDGAITRTVRDAAAILDAIGIPAAGEPYYAPPLPRPLLAEVGADPGRLRVGVLDRPDHPRYLDEPDCRAAVATAGRLLESLGHHVEESAPAGLFDREFPRRFNAMVATDTEAQLRGFEQVLGRRIDDRELEPRNLAHRGAGSGLAAVAYVESRAWLGRWARRVAAWWTDHDLLVTPTLGGLPPELGWFTAAGPDNEARRVASFIPYTSQFNVTGQPAMSLPLYWTDGGLPVGVQLVAAYGREDVLIRVASQLEQAAPWAGRRPPLDGPPR